MSQDKDNNEAASALHSAIMNLPCKPDAGWPGGEQHAYKLGHRDARHAAAELVAAAEATSALPARRFENVTGFVDADYVEFAAGETCGGGVLNGVPNARKLYTRADAEGFVRQGRWREVSIPAAEAASASQSNTPVASIEQWRELFSKVYPTVAPVEAPPNVRLRFAELEIANLRAHIASQSSTAGAAKGGSTCTKDGGECGIGGYCKECHLAHVARQRQESAGHTFTLTGQSHSMGICDHGDVAALGGVAEGVDTAEFRRLTEQWAEAVIAARRPGASKIPLMSARDAVVDYIDTTYGAQQREAGRRELQAELDVEREHVRQCAANIARLTVDLGAAKIRINKYERAVGASIEALARQPVSEGLTDERALQIAAEQDYGDEDPKCILRLIRAVEQELSAPVAAVPPAKAEGMSDCDCGCNDPVATEPIEMLEFLARRFEHAGVSSAVSPKYARDIRAILAQQAKGAKGAKP